MEKMFQTIIKILISLTIILLCTAVGKKLPSLAGLIGVMPLTGFLVMVFLYYESHGDTNIMTSYTKAALWAIIPSILFFLVAFFCFKKQLSLPVVIAVSFAVWVAGAIVHQWLLR